MTKYDKTLLTVFFAQQNQVLFKTKCCMSNNFSPAEELLHFWPNFPDLTKVVRDKNSIFHNRIEETIRRSQYDLSPGSTVLVSTNWTDCLLGSFTAQFEFQSLPRSYSCLSRRRHCHRCQTNAGFQLRIVA